jgi:formylglycine-generating enzyme required for sulfatase activity
VGRLHRALAALEKALSDIKGKEDNAFAGGLRDRAVSDIDSAINFTKQGITDAEIPPATLQPPSPVVPASAATASCKAGMAPLPAGTYKLGDQERTATVGPLCVDTTEVTVDAYTACVRAGRCSADHLGEWSTDGAKFTKDPKCNYGVAGRGNHPINCVDWQQAESYCHAEGKRLPSEEEWEWAARGATQARVYPWGGDAPAAQLCWSGVQKREGTCAVGSFAQGDAPGGIHDLAGNVWEWTSSSWDADHVYRGGSWHSEVATHPRAAERSRGSAPYRLYFVGFRCVAK